MFKSVSFLLRVLYDVSLSYAFTLQTHCAENSKQILQERKLHVLVPNFHIHVSVSNLYSPTIGPLVLRARPCSFISGNTSIWSCLQCIMYPDASCEPQTYEAWQPKLHAMYNKAKPAAFSQIWNQRVRLGWIYHHDGMYARKRPLPALIWWFRKWFTLTRVTRRTAPSSSTTSRRRWWASGLPGIVTRVLTKI